MAAPDTKTTVLALLHNNHLAVYIGREQAALYEVAEQPTQEEINGLLASWRDQNGNT